MTEMSPLDRPLSPDGLEAELRAIGAERYHHLHPFHGLLHGGKLTRQQVQAWALNRYYYQAMIPIKDAHALSKLATSDLRQALARGRPGRVLIQDSGSVLLVFENQ